MALKASRLCRELIANSVEFYPEPQIGEDTFVRIGYEHMIWVKGAPLRGTEGKMWAGVMFKDIITYDAAARMMETDLRTAESLVNRHTTGLGINQNQFDALVSLVCSIGAGRPGVLNGFVQMADGRTSEILTCLVRKDYAAAAMQFLCWTPESGPSRERILRRRLAERTLFLQDVRSDTCSMV